MKTGSANRNSRREAGIALLISIFVLLLVSVVAISLIVSSGTETAMAGNYRTATGVYYAALAGLEEGRGRLLANNPNSFKNTAPALLPPPGGTLAVGKPFYIINPAPGEIVAPWDPASTYPDSEFQTEFPTFALPNPSPSTNSLSNVGGIPGPWYKWVRINAVSEQSTGLDVDNDNVFNNDVALFYNFAPPNSSLTKANTGSQVYEVTSYAILPNGSQKLLQYLAAPIPSTLGTGATALVNFPAALTIAGSAANGVAFSAPPANAGFNVKGIDQDTVGGCVPGASIPAIGVFNDADKSWVVNGGNGGTGIPAAFRGNYLGSGALTPDVENVSSMFPPSLQTPTGMDALAQSVMQNADATVPPGNAASQKSFLNGLGMSPSNIMTVVVNGDLDLSDWNHTGYGVLLVTGNFNYDPDVSWYGVVLVIGKGTVTGSKNSNGEFDGAMVVAKTRDDDGNLLPNFGKSSINFNLNPAMQGEGVRYSSCWIQAAVPSGSFKILSFHEVSQ